MKSFILYYLLLAVPPAASAQYYLRGKILTENNKPIPNATVYLHSSKLGYKTDFDGSFGFSSSKSIDTISVLHSAYQKQTLAVKTDAWQTIVLKISVEQIKQNAPKLNSFTKDRSNTKKHFPFVSDETYFQLLENDFIQTSLYPTAGFSLNANKASYSNIRRFVNSQSPPPPDAVRVEEMVNYFNLGCAAPTGQAIFNITSTLTTCPWNRNNELLLLKICAKKIDLEKVPAGNFVFLIDVSGSMDMPNRLPLVKEAFYLFVKNLRPIDKVTIVTYGGMVGTWLNTTSGADKDKIINRISVLEAAGDTPGESAIDAAYKLAKANFIIGGTNRVILATDGDFNVGQTSEKALDELISKYRETGIFLTCLGVGMGNFKDSKLQTLAKRGNGNYAYLDNLKEAEKVLVLELTETLYAVANNAFVNINFDEKYVKEYRLLGYDNKKEAIQINNNEIDGGEIGSGSSSMAIFEISPTKKIELDAIGTLHLTFNETISKKNKVEEFIYKIPHSYSDTANADAKFAAAVTLYGLKLKASTFINNASWKLVKQIATEAVNIANAIQAEFLSLVNKTIEIYEPTKKKKKRGNEY